MSLQTTDYCHISGLTEDTDRLFLRKELSKFGEIRKIFIPSSREFAKIYFTDSHSARRAVQVLKQNIFGWIVSVQQDSKYSSSEASSTSRMNCDDEIDVQSSQQLYTVHGDCIESLEDDMGNLFVNLDDVRRTGFAVYSKEDYNFSIEEKRNIILNDFHQYMLSQAMAYLYKNKELHKFIKEEQILNTIERCRMKLLVDSHDKLNDRIVTQSNNNIQIRVPNSPTPRDTNKHIPQDKSLGSPRETEHPLENKNSFTDELDYVSTPKVPSNSFTPIHTQSCVAIGTPPGNRDSTFNRNNNGTSNNNNRQRFGQNRNERQISRNSKHKNRGNGRPKSKQRSNKPGTNSNNEELWDNDETEPKQQSQQFSKDSQFGKSRQQNATNNSNIDKRTDSEKCDTKSQINDTMHMDSLEKVNLEINQSYDVQITEVEKNNICWAVQTKSLIDLAELCLEDGSDLKIVENVHKGQLGLAEFENLWCRCQVMSLKPTNVFFVDYGNRADVSEIRELPDKFRKIPALAVRFAIHKNCPVPKTDTNLTVKVKKKYSDDTYVVELDKTFKSTSTEEDNSKKSALESVPKSKMSAQSIEEFKTESKERCYVDLPKPLLKLKNNDKVMLLDMVGNKFAVKTKECAQKSKELLEYIKTIDKSSLILKQVEVGQMVLASKDGLPDLCRAVVIKKQSSVQVTIEYLDYAGSENLSIKSLRNVDEYLASQPITLLLTPDIEVINKISETGIDFIVALIEKKEKANVVLTNDNAFDLKLEDGSLLSQKLLDLEKSEVPNDSNNSPKINELEKPMSVEAAITPLKSAILEVKPESDNSIITLCDMDYIKPKIGSTDTYICYTLKDLSEVVLISLDEDSVSYLESIYNLEINDDEPYEPEVSEMCVFLYKTPEESETVWYRGVVLDNEGKYTISMVDFGILVTTTSKDIRKFPAHLKDIPMLGIFCKLINIPHTPEILNEIRNIVQEGENVDVTIKNENDLTYDVELPKVYEELKKRKLL
ncbi:uncharacterized protein LOC130891580 isoform X2 [Diorhabda carinulata]|uniref:uncharacterized protein LOC130891580 isoform X2 n=1 Tax=Diorhabda carinulata TaxID=1163345 RepID=UPI0025A2C8E4|nr:uncharacterized protein LOC130891580 isoform X2 [Diorhabda carinulata]